MALYDDIIDSKNKKVNSANVKENKVFGNTVSVNNYDHTIYPYEDNANEVNNVVNTRWDTYQKPSQYVDQDIQGAGIIMETEDEPITHQCEINTSGDNFGHISDPTGIPIVTTKDITCRTSFFTIDLGVQVYQENDWYFPIVVYALNGGCIQCNNDVGCEKCNGCYNRAYSGSECPRCNGACTSGCTTGCTAANTAGMCANCDAGCVGCDNCNAGCTTACTAACVAGCTTACTDCDLEFTTENPETGETCTGCDGSCTSCDGCDSCVGSNVDHEIYWCARCDSHCVGCDGSCNTCTACTSCDGNVTQEQCKNDTSCQSACTNGCAEGCTTAQVSSCLECRGGCNNTCQNNQNGVGDGCGAFTTDCYQDVDCHGQVGLLGGCKKGVVTCRNNNANTYDCDNGVTRPCSSQNVDYEACKLLTTSWVVCSGNCNTGEFTFSCTDGEHSTMGNCNDGVVEIITDPTCDGCDGSCTTCDGCVTSCNESCNGCDTCNGCVGCDGGCASCDGCTTACQGCTATCVSGCASGCQSCVGSSCVSCVGGCYQSCVGCTNCASETGCSGCTTACQSCTGCDGCTSETSCSGCTTACMTCADASVCATCARSCTTCDGGLS